jgi:fatty-acyl-CoA synthase
LQREKVTVIVAAPTIYQMLTTAPNWKEADLSSLRFCQSGGAPVPVPLVEKYMQEKGVLFRQGFGMTEFGPGIFSLASEDAITKAGSIGRPNFFVDAKIMDDSRNFLESGQTGELVLKGPSYCSGYFNDPDANENAMDEYGYFHTGDLALYDAEGYFFIVDRKKDMFISGGENVYPVEVEKALYQHPAVHICAVIGIPDEKWGEIGKACVVLKPGQPASETELLDFLMSRLAKYKVPKTVTFMESLPISAVGKILKRDLRAMFSR